jgi:hypothetical protein
MNRPALLVAALVSSFLVARDARALGPIDFELAAKGGGATNPSSATINPLGLGAGGRGGVSFLGFYAGVDILYYVGGSHTGPTGVVAETETVTQHSLMWGLDLGYNLKLSIVTLRPQLGVGNLTIHTSTSTVDVCPNCLAIGLGSSSQASNLYLEPGVTALVSLGDVFVGADANVLVLPNIASPGGGNTTEAAFTLHAQVGVRF